MPYIKIQDRAKFSDVLDKLPEMETKGDLEYCIYRLIKLYMRNKEYRYSNLHDATYGCIHAGEEFKRRYLDKREDQAIDENGDIA